MIRANSFVPSFRGFLIISVQILNITMDFLVTLIQECSARKGEIGSGINGSTKSTRTGFFDRTQCDRASMSDQP